MREVLYEVDTTPLGRVLGEVIVSGEAVDAAAIVIAMDDEAVCLAESVTTKVKVLVPVLAGVPDKTPDALNPRPVLQAPEQLEIDHE